MFTVHETSDLGGQSSEAARFIQAQAGCTESLNQLMARHDGLIQALVRQQVPGELPFEEALRGRLCPSVWLPGWHLPHRRWTPPLAADRRRRIVIRRARKGGTAGCWPPTAAAGL